MTDLNAKAAAALDAAVECDGCPGTLRDYLRNLLAVLWNDGESFSGKRPFGNSGWEYDIYSGLITAGLVDGSHDEDGYVERVDRKQADKLVLAAIKQLQ